VVRYFDVFLRVVSRDDVASLREAPSNVHRCSPPLSLHTIVLCTCVAFTARPTLRLLDCPDCRPLLCAPTARDSARDILCTAYVALLRTCFTAAEWTDNRVDKPIFSDSELKVRMMGYLHHTRVLQCTCGNDTAPGLPFTFTRHGTDTPSLPTFRAYYACFSSPGFPVL
jgi:hypothetical protein